MTLNREGHKSAIYFVGPEIEHTPAFGMKTLFVVGIRALTQVDEYAKAEQCKHIYLAANCSFQNNKLWNPLVLGLLDLGYKVTLDWPVTSHNFVVDMLDKDILSNNNFIPIVSCKIQQVETFSKNLVVKIDDADFALSNSGVWCYAAHEILDRNRKTEWNEYGQDKILLSK